MPMAGETYVQMLNRKLEEKGRVDIRWTRDENGNCRLIHTGKPQPSQAFMAFIDPNYGKGNGA